MTKPLALVVEDDQDLSIIFGEALELANCKTKVIQDGEKALEWLAENLPSLVVLDLHLPNVGGKSILSYIRRQPHLANARVIITTADARLGESLRSQAQLVLIKPVSFIQLRNLAKRLLSR